MNLADWAARHSRSILFMLFISTLAGIYSAFTLPVALFPHIEFPRVSVSLDAGDRPAAQMMTEVTRPVEQAVKTVPGLREVRSTTSRGSAELNLNFDWGGDMDIATLQIQSAVTRVLPDLPAGTSFDVRRMNPTALYPVTAYAITSHRMSAVKLRDLARNEMVPLLSAIPGVASVDIMGGQTEEFRVSVDTAKLVGYGISMDDVTNALTAANILQVSGRLADRHKMLLVFSDARQRGIDDISHTIIRSGNDGVIELEDVATVEDTAAPQKEIIDEDGALAVMVQVFQQPDGNTVQIVQQISQALNDYKSKLPPGVTISNWYDQSQLIVESAKSVRDAILIGITLAALVLYLFLRDAAVTFVAIIAVPAVLAISVMLLNVFGMSFNIMTLGGLAASIGLVVDDAIVMIEQIVKRMHTEDGKPHHEIVRQAVKDFMNPLGGSSASTIIIFAPLTFLSGVTGAFFKALALTMACALLVSFLVAWFVIPLLSDRFLSIKDDMEAHGKIFDVVLHGYEKTIRFFIKSPLTLFAPLLVVLGVGLAGYMNTGSGFMPVMDEGGFIIDYVSPSGTSLEDTDALLQKIGHILDNTKEVMTYSRRTGQQLGGGLTEPNTGDFFVRLKPMPRRNIEEIMSDVRGQIEKLVPGLDIEMTQLMEDMIGDLTAVPQPVEIKIFGDDPVLLRKTAVNVAAALGKVEGMVDIFDGVVLAGDGIDVSIDQTKAALEGLDPATVAKQVDGYLSGVVVTNIETDTKTIGVRVWVPLKDRATIEDVGRFLLSAPDGHKVPLSRIAKISYLSGQPEITRDNLKTMVSVTGRIEGRDLGSTVADVKKMLKKPGIIPAGTYTALGGLYAQQQIAFHGLIVVMVSAVALVFLVLLFLYERFRVAFSIILMPLLSMSAVFIGLWLTGIELNISALMGMTMIVGIVTEIAIFFFSEYQFTKNESGVTIEEALVKAGINRFRPILMTTLAAILALLPLALGIGQGSDMQKPLAVAIISGLLIQMPLVLVVMPVLFLKLSGASMAKSSDS